MTSKSERPRDPKIVVQQAELLLAPPDRVRDWLERQAASGDRSRWWGDRDIELALLGRNDPLINLALARFGSNDDVLQKFLTLTGPENKATRLAILLNEVVGRANFGGTPEALVARKQDLGAFISGLDSEDIAALFSNPTLDGGFLGDFLEQEEPWQVLDEVRRLTAIHALQNNPRMSAEYEGPMDGYAEYRHRWVFTAAWELAAKVPPTAEWASAWLTSTTFAGGDFHSCRF